MNRFARTLAVVTIGLGVCVAGIGITAAQGDGITSIRAVDDVVIGEADQRFEGMRIGGFDDEVEELVIEIDVSVLEGYGIDIDGAEVIVPEGNVDGASLKSATVKDGVVTLVLEPGDIGLFVSEFWLTGLETAAAETATDVSYDISFSAGEGRVASFDIISPEDTKPSASSQTLVLSDGTQRVTVSRLQTTEATVTIELDLSVLEPHGIDLDNVEVAVESDEASVRETAVSAEIITIVLTPAAGTELFDIEVDLSGFQAPTPEGDTRYIASDIAHDIRLDGVATSDIDVETFDVITRLATPHSEPGPTATPAHATGSAESSPPVGAQPGFGWMATLLALVAVGLLAVGRGHHRRRER